MVDSQCCEEYSECESMDSRVGISKIFGVSDWESMGKQTK